MAGKKEYRKKKISEDTESEKFLEIAKTSAYAIKNFNKLHTKKIIQGTS